MQYFINIGSIDGLTKADLLHFISEVSSINRKAFGDLTLQKNFSYFEVRNDKDAMLEESFVGISVEGREIRVNLESASEPKKKSTKGQYDKRRGRSREGGGYGKPRRKGRRR